MGALVAVHGEQPAAGGARISLRLAPQKSRHATLADILQVFHEADVVGPDVALLDQQQAGAGKLSASIAEIDLAPGELAAQPFFMDAAPAPRPAADATRLGGIEHPAAKVAVHAAGGDQLALHGNHV